MFSACAMILVVTVATQPRVPADNQNQTVTTETTADVKRALGTQAGGQQPDVFGVPVLTPDGAPASAARIAFVVAGSHVVVVDGEVSNNREVETLQTDNAGRFHWPLEPNDFCLVITHRSGFAQINCSIQSLPETIRLTPWGRVEGTFRVARKPQGNVVIVGNGERIHGPGHGRFVTYVDFCRTDAQGRFVFERVIPGQAQFGPNLVSFPDGISHPPSSRSLTTVEVIAGKTARIDFGNSGRPVIGQLRLAPNSKQTMGWSFAMIQLNAKEPRTGKASSYFMASVDRNGNFCIDDVPPGKYIMSTYFPKGPQESLSNYHFTVPAINEKFSQRPVDLGVLTLEPAENRW
ncbi:MAG TPA: hypothetical protein VFG04_27925 [Planctomycetaceae bacterium]|nr:hypothetical protein [Planctomycetaceae bacterium]